MNSGTMSTDLKQSDATFDISLFVDTQIAQSFACTNCKNIPRQCINDADDQIFCEFCISELSITDSKANTSIDKLINGLKMECKQMKSKKEDSSNDDDDQTDKIWKGTVAEWRLHKKSENDENECKEEEIINNEESEPSITEQPSVKNEDENNDVKSSQNFEERVNAICDALNEKIQILEKKVNAQSKSIEHLKYRNCKLQMQIHQKETVKDDFLIIFESSNNKFSFISSLNFKYNSSQQNVSLIKPLNYRKENIIFKRVKDCSYCFAPNVCIDSIIGITSKSKQQHINSCVKCMGSCICTFNIIYRIGGDTLNVAQNHNICNILGTDVVFELPQLSVPRFNHQAIYSKIHGILSVGGEPIKKEDANRERKEIEKEREAKSRKKNVSQSKKEQKAILNSVEQLNLAPTPQLSHYYNVRNSQIKKDEQKLQMPPEPELNWRTLASPMKYRRDCPSIGLYKGGIKSEEQLFVAGGWNEKDLSYVEMYNWKKREWKQLASLNVKRNSAGICEWKQKNNNMIILGGWNKRTSKAVEEYDAHKNAWYALKNTNYAHKYYPACSIYHDLNPFINASAGVVVVVGNDGRVYGEEYMKKQEFLLKQKSNRDNQIPDPNSPVVQANDVVIPPQVKDDWGFIEFYDPRDWLRKWVVIDNLPSFLNFTDDQCKDLYFQNIIPCNR